MKDETSNGENHATRKETWSQKCPINEEGPFLQSIFRKWLFLGFGKPSLSLCFSRARTLSDAKEKMLVSFIKQLALRCQSWNHDPTLVINSMILSNRFWKISCPTTRSMRTISKSSLRRTVESLREGIIPYIFTFQPSNWKTEIFSWRWKVFQSEPFKFHKDGLQLLEKIKLYQFVSKASTITIVLPEIDNGFGIYVKANTLTSMKQDRLICIRRSRARKRLFRWIQSHLRETFLGLNNSESGTEIGNSLGIRFRLPLHWMIGL